MRRTIANTPHGKAPRGGAHRWIRDAAPGETPTTRSGTAKPDLLASDLDPDLQADLAALVEKAIAAILSRITKPDGIFREFSELDSFVRSVTYHEGKLLEWGLIRIAALDPDLIVMPQDRAMPIVPAALEMLERNGWDSLEGVRLRSEVHARESYTPDLIIIDPRAHSALILDLKRSLESLSERRLERLRKRMMAVALIAGDWLHVEGKVPPVSNVGIAIVDGSGRQSDRSKGIFAIGEIGDLIGIACAAEAMTWMRNQFGARVREELGRICRLAIGRPMARHGVATRARAHDAADEPLGGDGHDLGDGADDEPDEDAPALDAIARPFNRAAGSGEPGAVALARRRVSVGFAGRSP